MREIMIQDDVKFVALLDHFNWVKRLALSECHDDDFHLEKKITVLIDEKLKSKIHQTALGELIEGMKKHFKHGNMGLGFINSIENLEKKILDSFSSRVSDTNPSELSDTIHFITSM